MTSYVVFFRLFLSLLNAWMITFLPSKCLQFEIFFHKRLSLMARGTFIRGGCHMFFSVAILRGSSSSDIMLVIASGHHSPAPRCKLKFQRHAPTSAGEPNETEMRCRKKKRKSDPLSLWEKQSRSGRWRSSYLSALHHTHTHRHVPPLHQSHNYH